MGQKPALSENQNKAIASRIREELGRRRMSRRALADAAKISISTLEKALNGSRPFTLASVVRVEAALGITLRPSAKVPSARTDLGGYSRAGVTWLEGDYLTLRPSLGQMGSIFAYRTRICWDMTADCLIFHETDRMDAPFAQTGVVSLPNKSGQIYLYTNEQGQMRLAVLGRPQIKGEMYGLLTTLAAGSGNALTPVSTPLALIPWGSVGNPVLGRVSDTDSAHAGYKKHLEAILSEGFAKLIG